MRKLFIMIMVLIGAVSLNAQDLNTKNISEQRETNGVMYQKYSSYTTQNGTIFKVGDKLKIGVPSSNKTFAYIMQGDGILSPYIPAQIGYSGSECEIKKIYIGGTKKIGYYTGIILKSGMIKLTIYNVEMAIETGELKSNGYTSDEALSELKKSKDKLDLNVITQYEYDSIKGVLVKYIK